MACGIVITFHIVLLGWIFFRAASFGDALAFLGGLFAARRRRRC